MLEKIDTQNAPKAIGPYSQAIKLGQIIYTSGQIAIDPKNGEINEKDIAGQTKQVMENLSEILKTAGSSVENVIKTICFLTNMDDFAEFNKIYSNYITSAARSCVAVDALPKGALVEVEAVAVI